MLETARAARPLERMSVSEAAARYVVVDKPGSFTGPFDPEYTPYMIEPADTLASREYTGLFFCGPSQVGKTQLVQSWLAYGLKIEPADYMIVGSSQSAITDFTVSRIDRFHRTNRDFGKMLLPGASSDSMFRKMYRNGMILTLTWPSPTELSSKSIPRIFLTEYDRMPDNIGGEGSAYDLAEKRTITYRRNAMCVAESTPSRPIIDPRWTPSPDRPHEAPPCTGILGLYNRGDRRRWLWKCTACKLPFEPDFSSMRWPETADIMEAAEACWMECPHCAARYSHGQKNRMNLNGKWIKEGQRWLADGEVVGDSIRSRYASFWIKGPAARFLGWDKTVGDFLIAKAQYERTGDESGLISAVNTQHAMPYRPARAESMRSPEDLSARSTDLGVRVVPPGGRFLIACIDVQKSKFVVQVHAIGPGGDKWIVDRFNIRMSQRENLEAGGLEYVKPHSHPEDWNEIVHAVLTKTYPLGDSSGRHMPIKLTMCDSGGKDGVTANAYAFWRRLRRPPTRDADKPETMTEIPAGLHNRFQLLVGRPRPGAPRYQITYPDQQRRPGLSANAAGEIPVAQIHSDRLKDELDNALQRTEPRGGRINFPAWLEHTFYEELCAETRDVQGKWKEISNARNESWDLLAYCIAAGLDQRIGIERPDFWTHPPSWADEWDDNDFLLVPKGDSKELTHVPRPARKSLADLGKDFG